jgi:succinoglycan biosynthesis protein ExoM
MSQIKSNRKIAIGLCTYRRTALLETCLQSIGRLVRPDGVELCVIVVDNDGGATARSTVDAFKKNSTIPIYYEIERKRGIPCARNSVLNKAVQLGITELAFIDDDEYVDERWLLNLWTYYNNSDADVVRGFVKTIYPSDTPAWIVAGNFHQRIQHATGTSFRWAATNNVLFNFKKIVVDQGFFFDESFPLKGGSDSAFFKRVHANGSMIRFLDNAVVYEVLAPDRMTVAYYLKRKWREINTPSGLSRQSRFSRKRQIFSECKRAITILGRFLRCMFKGKHIYIKELGNLVMSVAKIFRLCGVHVKWNEYK